MMIILIFYSLFITMTLFLLTSCLYYSSSNRNTSVLNLLQSLLSSATPVLNNSKYMFMTLTLFLLVLNLIGNIPGMKSMPLFYWFTLSLSLTLWMGIMLTIYYTQLKSWVSHLLPYGSPMGLSILLPLIEGFSHIIRPLTLMIRISTNLSSGHIMLYMFSFFAVSSLSLTALITPVLILLMLLEIFVSALQAYIFSSLLLMYISESNLE